MSKENMSDHKMEYYSLNAKLCRLVQTNPCMYDRSSPNYPKKEYVERAWANIAMEMNDSVGSCKERWRNIRTAFARSINIYKTPTGPNRHKRYYLHDELQFLTKHIAPGLPSLPIRILTPTELGENHEHFRQSVDESEDNQIESSSPIPALQVEDESESSPETIFIDLQPSTSPVDKKRRLIDNEEFITDIQLRIKDPDKEFLNSILSEMKIMNTRQKILFKGKIYRALEEVFDNNKDFPTRIEPETINATAGMRTSHRNIGETNGTSSVVHTNCEPCNKHAAMVTLCPNLRHVKQEPINLNFDD